MAIIQHLYVDGFGMFVSKHSERLLVTKGKETLQQAPLLHLETLTIANQGVSISAEAVRECTERGIPIFFISGTGTPYASLYSAGLARTVATRRAQLEAFHTPLGLALVLAITEGKLQNQANLLKYIAKYRKEAAPEIYAELRRCTADVLDEMIKIDQIRRYPEMIDGSASIEALRAEIMGYEGRAAQRYWGALRQILPEHYNFPGRQGRGATDAINSAINYGYGILYGQCERCLVLAGLDPYAGFLHVDRPGKPSLTLDFIEQFRQPIVDRTIIGMANKNTAFEQDEQGLLSKETRRLIAEKVRERLETEIAYDGKRYPLRAIMQTQARHMAAYLRCERSTYEAYQMTW